MKYAREQNKESISPEGIYNSIKYTV
jgi:hypothetical protein